MTKQEAIKAMLKGEKVTHNYFTADEWITIDKGELLFEDGVRCPHWLFWQDRYGEDWQEGYSIFKPTKH